MDEKLIAAFIGFATGVAGSFIAPWVTWGVEKRRMRLQARKDAITAWRQVVARVVKEEEYADDGELGYLFDQEPDFLRLKPLLSDATRVLLSEGAPQDALEKLQEDINRIERSWHLL